MKHNNKKSALSERQKQVFDLHNKGVSVKDISLNLGIKTVTVYATLQLAKKKLGQVGRLNAKPVKGKSIKAHVPSASSALASFLSQLKASYESKGKATTAKTVNLGCTFQPADAKAKPEQYELACKLDDALNKLHGLAKAQGKTFVRRKFILEAIQAKLKEVLL